MSKQNFNSKNNAVMRQFTEEAEHLFSNFSGDEDNYYGDDDNYDGDDDNYDGDDDNYDGEDSYAPARGLDRIDPNDKTLSFTIENTSTVAGEGPVIATLFGAYKNGPAANFGNPSSIVITLGESSYAQFLEETKSSPVLVKGLRYFVGNETQFNNTLKMKEETAAGTEISQKYQPSTKVNPSYNKSGIIIDPSFTMEITGRRSLEIPVNKGEKITLVLTVKTRVDQANSLRGRAVLEVAGSNRKRRPAPKKRR